MRGASSCAGAILAFMVCSVACGSGDDDGTSTDPNATVSCTEDPRLDVYADGLDKAGELGVVTFHFSELEPNPPAKGSNTFHLKMNDAAGAAMQGGLGVDLKMPDHGHGTSVKPVVSFDASRVQYTVTPLYLFMPGVWEIRFDAYAGDAGEGTPLDSVVLHFCVEG
jgi:hypothetical protein